MGKKSFFVSLSLYFFFPCACFPPPSPSTPYSLSPPLPSPSLPLSPPPFPLSHSPSPLPPGGFIITVHLTAGVYLLFCSKRCWWLWDCVNYHHQQPWWQEASALGPTIYPQTDPSSPPHATCLWLPVITFILIWNNTQRNPSCMSPHVWPILTHILAHCAHTHECAHVHSRAHTHTHWIGFICTLSGQIGL